MALGAGGFVEVDRVSRTSARGVYAAGDCTGVLMLASVAAMQGRIAMWHALGDAVHAAGPEDRCPPTCSPTRRSRRSAVTQAEVDAGEIDGARASSCRSPRNARAKMQGIGDGFVKLFAPPGTRHRRRRRRRRAAGQRADLPGGARGAAAADRRRAGARVHGLPVAVRLGRRGRPPAARTGESLACPLFARHSSDDTSTASNALAGIPLSCADHDVGPARCRRVPWKYQGEPLSASTRPCFFIALRIMTVRGSSPAVEYAP